MKANLTIDEFAKYFDYVEGRRQPLDEYCELAKKYHVKCVATSMFGVSRCKEMLADTDVLVSGAVSFPGGNSTLKSKLNDIRLIIEQGADEIDYVISQYYLEENNWEYLYHEMKTIADFCREHNVKDKAIIEMCKLSKEEKIKICEIAKKAKPAFIKTSTGFSYGGAEIEDVKLMRSVVGNACKIKASGGIKDAKTALAFIEAGVDRIGASCALQIIDEYHKLLENK